MTSKLKFNLLAAALLVQCAALHAQVVEVTDAWVRTTVQGQPGTGAFMKLTSKEGARLVGATTPIAGVAEVHEMKLEGDIMRMRAVPGGLDLPAGKTVELKPGGFHIMLMDLKAALPRNATVPLTLVIKDAKGVESRVQVKAAVATVAPQGQPQHKH